LGQEIADDLFFVSVGDPGEGEPDAERIIPAENDLAADNGRFAGNRIGVVWKMDVEGELCPDPEGVVRPKEHPGAADIFRLEKAFLEGVMTGIHGKDIFDDARVPPAVTRPHLIAIIHSQGSPSLRTFDIDLVRLHKSDGENFFTENGIKTSDRLKRKMFFARLAVRGLGDREIPKPAALVI